MMNKALFLLLALTFPLFGADFLRVSVGPADIAIPMVVMSVIIVFGVVRAIFLPRDRGGDALLRVNVSLLIVSLCFVLCHLVSLLHSEFLSDGLEEFIKISIGIVCFWGCVLFLPKDVKFVEMFWMTVVWSSAILVSILLYRYGVVFRSEFLGTDLSAASRSGKNQLGWYVAVITVLAFGYSMSGRKKILAWPPLLLLTTALLHILSRGSWASAAAGLFAGIFITYRVNIVRGFKVSLIVFCLLAVMLGIGLWILSSYLDIGVIGHRFAYIFNPDVAPELKSYDVRFMAIREAWEGFLTSPIVGVGLTNYTSYATRLIHNDYGAILLELGLVGIGLFISLLVLIWRRMDVAFFSKQKVTNRIVFSSIAVYACVVSSLMFIDIYTSVHFWIILGLVIGQMDAQKNAFSSQG